jgi:hypothetical protein
MSEKALTVLPTILLMAASIPFLCHFILSFRRLKGTDEKSKAFRMQIEQRAKNSSLIRSIEDYRKVLLLGIWGAVFLLSVLAIHVFRAFE